MRKKDIIRLLKNANEETVEQISRDHPILTDQKREELFDRIEQKLQTVDTENTITENEEHFPIVQKHRSARMFSSAFVAACMLIFCGTFAGLFWAQSHVKSPSELESSECIDHYGDRAHAVGERYAAENLTRSGALWLTVTEAVTDGDLYRVRVTLKSDHAVSVTDRAADGSYLFMADNFMAAIGQNDKNWIVLSPCRLAIDGDQGSLPHTFSLRSGESCELSLWFRADELPEEWKLVTSYSTAYPYTVIRTKEN